MAAHSIEEKVEQYYSDKVRSFGDSPRGVDWNSEHSQQLRFRQLLKVVANSSDFSLLDFGCGTGHLLDFMHNLFDSFSFIGFDLSTEMIGHAIEKYGMSENTSWLQELKEDTKVDYLVSSGLFNVRLDETNENWKDYIIENLHSFDKLTNKGFSFNMLTKYSDKPLMKDYLYYADPMYFFDFCKRNFSRNVALLHDYELYEFTIIVRK